MRNGYAADIGMRMGIISRKWNADGDNFPQMEQIPLKEMGRSALKRILSGFGSYVVAGFGFFGG